MHSLAAIAQSRFVRIQLIAFLYNLAANMIHPITPTLITELGLPEYMFGVMFASMSLGSFIFSTFWGRMADRRGRVPVIVMGLLVYAIGQVCFGYSTNPIAITAFRFISGTFAGGATVALMAAVVDVSKPNERASNLSYFAANLSLSGSLGYFLGGMLGVALPSLIGVFWVHASLLILDVVLCLLLVKETLRHDVVHEVAEHREKRSSFMDAIKALSLTSVLFLLCVALSSLATTGFDNTFNYYIKDEFNFASSTNGIIKAVVGIMGLLANVLVNPWIIRRFEPRAALTAILALCSATLLMVTLIGGIPGFIVASLLFYLFNSMYMPLQQALVAQNNTDECGMLSGMFYSARNFGSIIGALSAGFLYAASAKLPFFVQVAVFALAAVIALFSTRAARREVSRQPAEVK